MAVGMGLAKRADGGTIYTLLSDGELQEGSTWEAILIAPSLALNNIVAFVDNNDFQSAGQTSITHPTLYPIGEKFRSFGWEIVEIDGHDTNSIRSAVLCWSRKRPLAVVAKTTKGKGVSFMENEPAWHYRSPNKEEYAKALTELES